MAEKSEIKLSFESHNINVNPEGVLIVREAFRLAWREAFFMSKHIQKR